MDANQEFGDIRALLMSPSEASWCAIAQRLEAALALEPEVVRARWLPYVRAHLDRTWARVVRPAPASWLEDDELRALASSLRAPRPESTWKRSVSLNARTLGPAPALEGVLDLDLPALHRRDALAVSVRHPTACVLVEGASWRIVDLDSMALMGRGELPASLMKKAPLEIDVVGHDRLRDHVLVHCAPPRPEPDVLVRVDLERGEVAGVHVIGQERDAYGFAPPLTAFALHDDLIVGNAETVFEFDADGVPFESPRLSPFAPSGKILAYQADGSRILTSLHGGVVEHDLIEHTWTTRFDSPSLPTLASYSLHGETIAVRSIDPDTRRDLYEPNEQLVFLEARSGATLMEHAFIAGHVHVDRVSFAPDGQYAMIELDNNIQESTEAFWIYDGHEGVVCATLSDIHGARPGPFPTSWAQARFVCDSRRIALSVRDEVRVYALK